MESWSSLELFFWSCGLSAIASIGSLCLSGEPITTQRIVGCVLFHGSVGGGLGLFASEKLTWKHGSVLATAIFYGAGIVRVDDIRKVIIRALGATHNGHSRNEKN